MLTLLRPVKKRKGKGAQPGSRVTEVEGNKCDAAVCRADGAANVEVR